MSHAPGTAEKPHDIAAVPGVGGPLGAIGPTGPAGSTGPPRPRGFPDARALVASQGHGRLELIPVLADLATLAGTPSLAERLDKVPRIDVLVHNAGTLPAHRKLASEGFEESFAVNHVTPFVLDHLLRRRLVASAGRGSCKSVPVSRCTWASTRTATRAAHGSNRSPRTHGRSSGTSLPRSTWLLTSREAA